MNKRENQRVVDYLAAKDERLADVIARVGPYRLVVEELSPVDSAYLALAESIIYQQITGKAAASILKKVIEGVGDGDSAKVFPAPASLLARGEDELRACGLSRGKQLALRDLARRSESGELPTLEEMKTLDDEALIERLVTIRGIGRWTVQMMLIFRLGRTDVMPHTDYGVRKGFTLNFKRLPRDPRDGLATPASLLARAERWRPHRTCAAWYLWRSLDIPG